MSEQTNTSARAATGVDDVPAAFDGVATTYDLMVGLSPGYHTQLRSSADRLVASAKGRATAPVAIGV